MSEKRPKDLTEHLHPNEEVLYAVKKKLGIEKPKWLVVTTHRVIYFDEKILGRYEMKAIPYEKLEEVYVKIGKMYAEFVIKDESGDVIKLDKMDKEKSKKAVEAIRDALNAIAVEPVSIEKKKHLMGEELWIHKPKETVSRSLRIAAQGTAAKDDPLEKLKKLKELYDMGVITQEEYKEKRRNLLEQI